MVRNDTHGSTGSGPQSGIACGWGPGRELPANETFEFSWTWNGTVHELYQPFTPAPPGVYEVTLWTAWAESGTYRQEVHAHDTTLRIRWPPNP